MVGMSRVRAQCHKKTRRVGQRCTLNLSRAEMSSRCVRALVPQKFSVEEELMHVKHVEVKSPHVGVMWKFGWGVISSGATEISRNITARVIERDTSGEIYYFPEDSRWFRTRQLGRQK
ncbi:hypothetical protein TNCV_4367991 [Trichonephila clavipes]|nr:hypothetical protein TNCV_4367991 [Trichonephila clavipes]